MLLPNGTVLVTGGQDGGSNVLSSTELYNPAAGTFTAAAGNLSKARTGLTATLLDSALVLVVGGSNSTDGTLSSAELYTPSFDPLGTVTVASSDTNDQISGTCALALTGTGATMCTAAVTPPHVDTATHTITASYPADNVHSASDNSSQSDSKNVLTVTKGTPVIVWSAPAPIGYGTALSATQLDASASYNSSPLAGSFAYTPAAGSVLAAGTQTLSVTFTPTDNADYTTATQTVQLRVKQAPLTVTANNKTKAYGAPLPILDASYSGFVNGEGASVLSGTLSCTTTATHEPCGGQPIPHYLFGANFKQLQHHLRPRHSAPSPSRSLAR